MPAARAIWGGSVLLFAIFAFCTSNRGKSFVPAIPGYNDKEHQVFVLKRDLLEISGITHLGGSRFACINDENGDLFFINLENDSTERHKFKGKGDYEDIARVGDTYFILESNGNIIEVKPPYESHETYKFKGENIEFESLVYYPNLGKLMLITKDQKKKTNGIQAFSFDLKTKDFDEDPYFSISFKKIFTILTNYNTECKPSAAAINPINKRLYIIASVGKALLECEQNGKLLHIYKINPAHFPQPEGITFADNGDMYISNEGADGKATILKFPYGGGK